MQVNPFIQSFTASNAYRASAPLTAFSPQLAPAADSVQFSGKLLSRRNLLKIGAIGAGTAALAACAAPATPTAAPKPTGKANMAINGGGGGGNLGNDGVSISDVTGSQQSTQGTTWNNITYVSTGINVTGISATNNGNGSVTVKIPNNASTFTPTTVSVIAIAAYNNRLTSNETVNGSQAAQKLLPTQGGWISATANKLTSDYNFNNRSNLPKDTTGNFAFTVTP